LLNFWLTCGFWKRKKKHKGKARLRMVTVEGRERTLEPQPRVFKGREEFESNVLHAVVALGIWLGAIHFNVALLLFSLYFLPLSKSLLFAFWPFPFFFFLSFLFLLLLLFLFNFGSTCIPIRVFGLLALFMVIPVDDKSRLGRRLSRSASILFPFFRVTRRLLLLLLLLF
jgi:hypothetical protein